MPKPHILFVAVELAFASFAIGCLPRGPETASPTDGGPPPEAGSIAVVESGLPCDVTALLAYCVGCHGATPSPGVPMSLVTLADLTRPAHSNPGVTVAGMALMRMQDATRTMPPPPAIRPSDAQIAGFSAWVASGYVGPACGSSTGAGAGGSSGSGGSAGSIGGVGNMGGGGAPATPAGVGGGAGATGAAGTTGAAGMSGTSGATTGVPCDVQAVFAAHCTTCHGARPSGGAPMSLVTYADLTAPAHSDPTRTVAALAVQRMQSTTNQMPPAPAARVASGEIATISSWIAAGYPATGCGTGTGGAAGGGSGSGSGGATGAGGSSGATDGGSVVTPDPFAVPPTCTSKTYWSGGEGAATMDPGLGCISCHQGQREAPSFAIAGTLYPTAHEPDNCNGAGAAASAGARVVITGADGNSVTLTPNSAGNFYYQGAVATPFRARVTYMGRTREMGQSQTSGDCNSCHTQNGANQAPGRILLP